MAKVRGSGNRSTELHVQEALLSTGIKDWIKHPDLPGKPDFYFPEHRLVLFVDGCFWHGCPRHVRYPKANANYWFNKIDRTRRRDNRIRRGLRDQGYHVMRVWEHDLSTKTWLRRLESMLARTEKSST